MRQNRGGRNWLVGIPWQHFLRVLPGGASRQRPASPFRHSPVDILYKRSLSCLCGALEFARLANSLGIQPITGGELTLQDGSRLTLLAKTHQGYTNISRLFTLAGAVDRRAQRPRYHVHFTPTGSSWLNLVERWFGLLTEKQLRRGVHRSTRELEEAITRYVESTNAHAKPFVWTKTADEILASVCVAFVYELLTQDTSPLYRTVCRSLPWPCRI